VIPLASITKASPLLLRRTSALAKLTVKVLSSVPLPSFWPGGDAPPPSAAELPPPSPLPPPPQALISANAEAVNKAINPFLKVFIFLLRN